MTAGERTAEIKTHALDIVRRQESAAARQQTAVKNAIPTQPTYTKPVWNPNQVSIQIRYEEMGRNTCAPSMIQGPCHQCSPSVIRWGVFSYPAMMSRMSGRSRSLSRLAH